MKRIILLSIIFLSLKGYSQYVTYPALDSAFNTLDSSVEKPKKITLTNETIALDTLTTSDNSVRSFMLSVEMTYRDTNGAILGADNTIKVMMIKKILGFYSIVTDYDMKPFSFNKSRSMFTTRILYQVSSHTVGNQVIISATGQQGQSITWKLTRYNL